MVRRLLAAVSGVGARWPIDAAPVPVYVMWLLVVDVPRDVWRGRRRDKM